MARVGSTAACCVGDPNYLYQPKSHYKEIHLPNVTINNVNFIRNNAKGGSGSAGSGGGLGTGGAITLLAGDLEVTNSIFQGLKAEGEVVVAPTQGAWFRFQRLIKRSDAKNGASGGKGGFLRFRFESIALELSASVIWLLLVALEVLVEQEIPSAVETRDPDMMENQGNLEPVHPSLEWVEVVEVPVVVEPGVSTKAFFVSPSQE